MKVGGQHYRSIWANTSGARSVNIVDQTKLPYCFVVKQLTSDTEMVTAISKMQVRGAPLIGVAGVYGLALAMDRDPSSEHLATAYAALLAARPTAVNLGWALQRMRALLEPLHAPKRADAAWAEAAKMADEDVQINRRLGAHGAELIAQRQRTLARPLNILTHCNTGWLATVDFGTALSAIYQAHDTGVPLHVWVDETRPRNQGLLTAWELKAHGVPHTFIVDSAGGHLMQQGKVDMVIVGADRVSTAGDVANKIGTYLKALAAHASDVPFYAAVPSSTIDWAWHDTLGEIHIEERSGAEVREVSGLNAAGAVTRLRVVMDETPVANPAFDVTPARWITGITTERGTVAPGELAALFADRLEAA